MSSTDPGNQTAFQFIQSSHHRVIHGDGVWGGPTPQGNITQSHNLPVSNGSESPRLGDSIVSLPDKRYDVIQPIPVVYEKSTDGWIAWFEHAGIGMSGATMTEAKELISHEILDALVLYTENEEKLGPGPKTQLRVLRSYIRMRT